MGNAIFVDLRDRELSCYAFEKNGKSGPMKELFTSPVVDDYSFALEESFERERESYLSLPLGLLDFRVLELPFTDVRKIRELVPFEIDNLVLGGAGNVVYDVLPVSRAEGGSRVLVAYMPKDTLGTILGRLKTAGIDPKAVVSLELAAAVSSSASPEKLANRLLAPEPLDEGMRQDVMRREAAAPTINLRRGEFAYTVDDERTQRSLKLTAILVLLLLLVFAGDSVMGIIAADRENSAIRTRMRKTYQVLFPSEKRISNELYQLKAHIKELRDKEESFVGVSPLGVLLDLSGVRRPGVVFSEVSVDRDNIVLKGECPTLGDVQNIKTSLEKILSGVNISDTKPSAQNKMLFTITAKGRKA
ncbi:MAG: hypothetical protein M0Z60_11315 [Nitrospiraceae bacterium]|nr:hypothetical protein [Nitrospiraceae bacterium]